MPVTPEPERLCLHATTVAWSGNGLLILGDSGTGKSSLALTLMAFGCALVADDRTLLERRGDELIASCPDTIVGTIEARGIGLLNAPAHPPVPLAAALYLGVEERERLPPKRICEFLGCRIPAIHNPGTGHAAAAILQYLRYGRKV